MSTQFLRVALGGVPHMRTGFKATLTGIGLCSSGAVAQPAAPSELDLKVQPSITTVANNEGDIGVLGGLKLTKGDEFRLSFLAEKPSTSDELFSNSRYGLDIKLDMLTLNVGTIRADGSSEFNRLALGVEATNKSRLRFTYSETPTDEQLLVDGRLKFTEEFTVQGALDNDGNFRVRGLFEWGNSGASVAFGRSGDDFVNNVSFHTPHVWISGSYSDTRGFGGRLVLGDIPKNRSDLFGEFSAPGTNDISLVPDQTVRTFVGANPSFGLLAFAPDTFLADEPGSVVLDLRAQENTRASAHVTARLGNLGVFTNNWASAGVYHDFSDEYFGTQLEVGTALGAVNLRLQAELKEDQDATLGLYLKIPF